MRSFKLKFEELKATTYREGSVGPEVTFNRFSWSQLTFCGIRINFDATVKNGVSFIGLLVRDCSGKIVNIKSIHFETDVPELAEAYGVFQGLVLAEEEGWQEVWCRLDARNFMLNINN